MDLMQIFFDSYLKDFRDESIRVLDVGSQVVDEDARSYKQLLTGLPWAYTGLDISPGMNVDVCVKDPYVWPELASDSFDVVISGQTFEHVPYFWTLAYEMGRVLRQGCFGNGSAERSSQEPSEPLAHDRRQLVFRGAFLRCGEERIPDSTRVLVEVLALHNRLPKPKE